MKKSLSYILLLLLAIMPVRAQLSAFPQARLESLMKQTHYRDCASLADSLVQAIVHGKPQAELDSVGSRQLLIATWYKANADGRYLDIRPDSNYRRHVWVLPYLTVGDRCMARLFLEGPDSVMQDTALYKQIRLDKSLPILAKEGTGFNTCPSLYFLVMNVAARSHSDAQPYFAALRSHCRTFPYNSYRLLLQLYYDYQFLCIKYTYLDANLLPHLQQLLSQYRTCQHEYLGEIYYHIAKLYHEQGGFDSALNHLDTAICRYPQYEIGGRCRQLKNEILLPEIELRLGEMYPAQKHSLFHFRSHNIDTAYFRVVKYQDGFRNKCELIDSLVIKAAPVAEWSQAVCDSASHRWGNYAGYLPPLSEGQYVLIASSKCDAATGDYAMMSFSIHTAIALMLGPLYEADGVKGYLFNYGTGEAIPNAKVRLRNGEMWYSRVLGSTTTDPNGYFCINPKGRVDFDGYPDLMLEFYHQVNGRDWM